MELFNLGSTKKPGSFTVLATAREGYLKTSFSLKEFSETLTYSGFWKFTDKYFKTGIYEMHRSLRKKAFTKSLNLFVPEIQMEDLEPLRIGVQAHPFLLAKQLPA